MRGTPLISSVDEMEEVSICVFEVLAVCATPGLVKSAGHFGRI